MNRLLPFLLALLAADLAVAGTNDQQSLQSTNSIKMVFCKNGQLTANEVQSLLQLARAKGLGVVDQIVTTANKYEIFIRMDERKTKKDDIIRQRSINAYKKGWVNSSYEVMPNPSAKVSVGDFFTDRVYQSYLIEADIAGEIMHVIISEGISKNEFDAIFTAISKGNIRAIDDGQTGTVARIRKEGLKSTVLARSRLGENQYYIDLPSGTTVIAYTNGEVVVLGNYRRIE